MGEENKMQVPDPTSGNIEDSQKILERLIAKRGAGLPATKPTTENKLTADDLSARFEQDKKSLRETTEKLRKLREGLKK